MRAPRISLASLLMHAAQVVCVAAANAAAPPVKDQAPGYYRMLLGDFEITALNDGTLALDVKKLLTNTSPVRVDQLLKRSFLGIGHIRADGQGYVYYPVNYSIPR